MRKPSSLTDLMQAADLSLVQHSLAETMYDPALASASNLTDVAGGSAGAGGAPGADGSGAKGRAAEASRLGAGAGGAGLHGGMGGAPGGGGPPGGDDGDGAHAWGEHEDGVAQGHAAHHHHHHQSTEALIEYRIRLLSGRWLGSSVLLENVCS